MQVEIGLRDPTEAWKGQALRAQILVRITFSRNKIPIRTQCTTVDFTLGKDKPKKLANMFNVYRTTTYWTFFWTSQRAAPVWNPLYLLCGFVSLLPNVTGRGCGQLLFFQELTSWWTAVPCWENGLCRMQPDGITAKLEFPIDYKFKRDSHYLLYDCHFINEMYEIN